MQLWLRWAIASPAIVLVGFDRASHAAAGTLDFTSGVPSAVVTPPVTAQDEATPDHRLSFAPPSLPMPSTETAIAPSSESSPEAAPLPVPAQPIPTSPDPTALPPPPLPGAVAQLFEGDADSLVARAVGSAEGTRTPDGQRTLAYYGHVDPGNRAWNQGTFSYQHGAPSPEAADQRQLQRLQTQAQELHRLASAAGLSLTREETLNGLDLANQAPLAALDRGYIVWLKQAKQMGLTGAEAILWARTRSFLDPDTGRWNAPGLGNSIASISHDQARRQRAIAQAIAVNSPESESPRSPTQTSPHSPTSPPPQSPEQVVDIILSMDLPHP